MSYDISLVSSQTSLASSQASAASSTTTSTAAEEAAETKEMFLKLLLTQLENQDPLEPVDTTEFTNQLVSYSSLEQQIETNEKLDELTSAVSSSSSFSALSFMGATVDVESSSSVIQEGSATWTYALEESASDLTLQVQDQNGNVIDTIDMGSTSAGTYEFTLNADDYEGLENGDALTLVLAASDADGNEVATDISAKMKVETIETDSSGNITLQAGDYSFSSNEVTTIYQGS